MGGLVRLLSEKKGKFGEDPYFGVRLLFLSFFWVKGLMPPALYRFYKYFLFEAA